MKVKATRTGFYGNELRKEGDTFTLEAVKAKGKDGKDFTTPAKDQFSESWMVALSKPGPKPKVVESSYAPESSITM